MQVFMNDTPVQCAPGTTVAGLLAAEGIATQYVAVAVGERVVPRADWEGTILTEGAKVMVIRAVQGG